MHQGEDATRWARLPGLGGGHTPDLLPGTDQSTHVDEGGWQTLQVLSSGRCCIRRDIGLPWLLTQERRPAKAVLRTSPDKFSGRGMRLCRCHHPIIEHGIDQELEDQRHARLGHVSAASILRRVHLPRSRHPEQCGWDRPPVSRPGQISSVALHSNPRPAQDGGPQARQPVADRNGRAPDG